MNQKIQLSTSPNNSKSHQSQNADAESLGFQKKVGCIIIVLVSILILILFFAGGYIAYLYWEKIAKKETDKSSTSTTETKSGNDPYEGWKAIEEDTDLIYLLARIPESFTTESKLSDLYITLYSEDNLIKLYIAGECDGCTVIPMAQENFDDLYTRENISILMNNQTCTRDAYISKETGTYELYEVTCLEDEEVHIWGECKDTKSQLELCDKIVEGIVVENL